MIQPMLRNRQRQNPSHFSTLVTISSLSAMSGMRCKTKTKATEKTPEASIHLKQGIQFEKIILWGFLVKITDPRPSLASGGCHATAWWFPRWDTGSFKNSIKAHISVAVTRVQDKHWVWKSLQQKWNPRKYSLFCNRQWGQQQWSERSVAPQKPPPEKISVATNQSNWIYLLELNLRHFHVETEASADDESVREGPTSPHCQSSLARTHFLPRLLKIFQWKIKIKNL